MAPKRKYNSRRTTMTAEEAELKGVYREDRHGPEKGPLALQKPVLTRLPTKKDTKRWIRSEADERAVSNGCRFSERLAEYVLEWIRTYIRHGEGFWAGKPFEPMDWQRVELFMPLFGWVKKSDRWGGQIVRRINRVYCEVPKKSGKSPTGAVIGTYAWAGDGEQGAKVYTVATDKYQAGIVHDHAIQMVEDSPELSALTKINRTTRHMLFTSTRSTYDVKSSVVRGSHGLNASCAILDELHAWYGDALYRSLKYMFRTRVEPILFQITTAGDDMDSVCRQQHDYAQGVIGGEIQDDGFLPVIYAVDEKTEDWRDDQVWQRVNPSMGKLEDGKLFTVDDMRQEYNEAKNSPAAVSTFKRYLLNIWATGESPWLDGHRWAECQSEYVEQDLLGQVCYGGIDLSKTKDFTSFALNFPSADEPGVFRQLVYFWLPEATVQGRAHLASYRKWQQQGWIEVTPGTEVDYEYVRERILSINALFDLKSIAYDPLYAGYFTQRLEEEEDIPREEFRQTVMRYTDATTEYERLINAGLLQHNGNSVLTWQAGHVCVWTDNSGNIRPVKRKRGDYRTIDGIAASVMALDGAMRASGGEASVYDERGEFLTVDW